jgi:hypothetical protein
MGKQDITNESYFLWSVEETHIPRPLTVLVLVRELVHLFLLDHNSRLILKLLAPFRN